MRAIRHSAWLASALLLAACGADSTSRSPTTPSATGPIAAGVYRLTLVSNATTSSCVGTTPPAGIPQPPLWGIEVELRLQRDGEGWVGRSERPGSTTELRLRLEEGVRVTGTLQGRSEHWLNAVVAGSHGSVDVGGDAGPARLDGLATLLDGSTDATVIMAGSLSGTVRYVAAPLGDAVCAGAVFGLRRF